MTLSVRQIEQRRQAGKAGYRKLMITAWEMFKGDPDRAAQWVSCRRIEWGFRYRNGLTRAYMINKWRELNLYIPQFDPELQPELPLSLNGSIEGEVA